LRAVSLLNLLLLLLSLLICHAVTAKVGSTCNTPQHILSLSLFWGTLVGPLGALMSLWLTG
jgi:hypothetical protein